MKTIIFLNKEWFTSEDKVILSNEYFNIGYVTTNS